jgi:hypothetical protein
MESKIGSSKKVWFVLLVLALILSLHIADRQPKIVARQEFPASWKVDEILTALAKTGNPGPHSSVDPNPRAYILTWKIQEDDRPWYSEECILWVHYQDSNRRKLWTLAHVARSPKPPPQGWGSGWELAKVYDAPVAYYRVFAWAPTNQDVYKFLHDSWWEFGPSDGFKTLEAGVCVETWREAIGEAPTEFFGS